MAESSRITLRPVPDSKSTESEVVIDGQATGHIIGGRVLEAQFPVSAVDATLLWITDDTPYEETLHVYLLRDSGETIEEITLGAPYASGILKNTRMVSSNEFVFEFQGTWRVIVHAKPKGFLRRRHLELQPNRIAVRKHDGGTGR